MTSPSRWQRKFTTHRCRHTGTPAVHRAPRPGSLRREHRGGDTLVATVRADRIAPSEVQPLATMGFVAQQRGDAATARRMPPGVDAALSSALTRGVCAGVGGPRRRSPAGRRPGAVANVAGCCSRSPRARRWWRSWRCLSGTKHRVAVTEAMGADAYERAAAAGAQAPLDELLRQFASLSTG